MCLSLQNSPQMISNQLSIFLCFEKCSQKTNFDRLKSRGTHPFDRFIWLWNTKSRIAWKITVKLINRLRETFSWSINFHFKLNINWFLDFVDVIPKQTPYSRYRYIKIIHLYILPSSIIYLGRPRLAINFKSPLYELKILV